MSFNLRVTSITNKNDSGSVELSQGVVIPSGQSLSVSGNHNIIGVATVGFLTASNVTAGVITATSFAGDGTNLTNITTVSLSKAIALKYILADPPLRS